MTNISVVRIIFLGLIITVLIIWNGALLAQAPDDRRPAGPESQPLTPTTTLPPRDRDMKGVWIHPRNLDDRAEIDQVIRQAEIANFNTLFVNVWLDARSFYQSDVLTNDNDEFDALAYVIEQAKPRDMEVHAWMVVGWQTRSPVRPGPIFEANPDWYMRDACGTSGRWMSMAHPGPREFVVDVATELAQNYDIAGIHFDYIRYSGPGWGFEEVALAGFEEGGGDPEAILQPNLPAYGAFTGNPLTMPTTAQVLATFDGTDPAIFLNEYGEGEVLLINWNVTLGCQMQATGIIMERALDRMAGSDGPIYLLDESGVTSERFVAPVEVWIDTMGRNIERIAGDDVADLDPDGVVLLPSAYRISDNDDVLDGLAAYTWDGGHLIFIDGPTPSYNDPVLQALIGTEGRGDHFNREARWILPTEDHPLIPRGDATWTNELSYEWESYRQANVTAMVRTVREAVLEANPNIEISAAVFRNAEESLLVGQDWATWLADYALDFAAPMAYVDKGQADELIPLIEEWQTLPAYDQGRIIPGLITFNESDESALKSPQEMLDEIELIFEADAPGVVLFDIYHLSEETTRAVGNEFDE